MALKKKKRYTIIDKSRILILIVIFLMLNSFLCYSLILNLSSVNDLNKQVNNLKNQKVELNDEKESLEADISKLEDPDYIARYVREKYLYSKDGELILRFNDIEKKED